MSASFSRSIRTMRTKTSGGPVIVLLVVVLFLAGWLVWLVGARVPVYALSETAVLTTPAEVTAQFPPDALSQIAPGQSAWLRLDDFPADTYGLVAATVVTMDETLQDGRFQATLRLNPPTDSQIPFQPGLTGVVEIEVEKVTPAALLLRTAGK